jgi:hypothetical protein
MATDDWFWGKDGWARRHVERFPRGDWPGFESEFWGELRHLFVTKGVTEAVADAASRRLFGNPPEFVGQHPSVLLAAVREVWREAREATPAVRPEPVNDCDSAWNAAAELNWELCLTDDEREAWLDLAAARLPCWRKGTKANRLLAAGWAYDPTLVVDLPPPEAPMPRRGPRRVFEGYQPKEVS